MEHFEALRKVFLVSQGDLISEWLDQCFHFDWLQSAKDSSLNALNQQLELCLQKLPPHDSLSRFKFIATAKGQQLEPNPNFFFTLQNVSLSAMTFDVGFGILQVGILAQQTIA